MTLHEFIEGHYGSPEIPSFLPCQHENTIGILMTYRFADGKLLPVRLQELFEENMPAIIESTARMHGEIVAITGPDREI
jgi:hypothetical protein